VSLGIGPALHNAALVATFAYGRERVWQVGLFGDSSILGGDDIFAAALQYGPSRSGRWHRVAVAAGPAYVSGRLDGSHFGTLGLVVSAQAIATPLTEFGIGLNAFANVNPDRPTAGVAVTFVFEGNK
jgi:hypothetical protein